MLSNVRASIIVLVLLPLLALPAAACLWDDDTLRAEARGMPELIHIITGRFERNPPLYYEMRLARSIDAMKANPRDWEAYDNAGVACDRLGRHDEAIEWMERKRDEMHRAGGLVTSSLEDHQYRYLANLGTFHAHRWFAHGANRAELSDMREAERLITAAIVLNPDAHFGRERYQLLAIRWVLSPPTGEFEHPFDMLPVLFLADPAVVQRMQTGWRATGNLSVDYSDSVQGLSGLVALGNAWESVDVFFALTVALKDSGHSAIAHLAQQRWAELIRSGRRSLHPEAFAGEKLLDYVSFTGFATTAEADVEAFFREARAAAEAWHQGRTTFMVARLQSGLHPDTHPDFWDGYNEVPPIQLPNGVLGFGRRQASRALWVAITVAVGALLSVGVICIMRQSKASRSLHASEA